MARAGAGAVVRGPRSCSYHGFPIGVFGDHLAPHGRNEDRQNLSGLHVTAAELVGNRLSRGDPAGVTPTVVSGRWLERVTGRVLFTAELNIEQHAGSRHCS